MEEVRWKTEDGRWKTEDGRWMRLLFIGIFVYLLTSMYQHFNELLAISKMEEVRRKMEDVIFHRNLRLSSCTLLLISLLILRNRKDGRR